MKRGVILLVVGARCGTGRDWSHQESRCRGADLWDCWVGQFSLLHHFLSFVPYITKLCIHKWVATQSVISIAKIQMADNFFCFSLTVFWAKPMGYQNGRSDVTCLNTKKKLVSVAKKAAYRCINFSLFNWSLWLIFGCLFCCHKLFLLIFGGLLVPKVVHDWSLVACSGATGLSGITCLTWWTTSTVSCDSAMSSAPISAQRSGEALVQPSARTHLPLPQFITTLPSTYLPTHAHTHTHTHAQTQTFCFMFGLSSITTLSLYLLCSQYNHPCIYC